MRFHVFPCVSFFRLFSVINLGKFFGELFKNDKNLNIIVRIYYFQ